MNKFLSAILCVLMLQIAPVAALPAEALQDIWRDHLLFRAAQAESPVERERELRLLLHIEPRDREVLLRLSEQYMDQEHWLGTAMLSRLGREWHPDEVAFEVFDEETTSLLNLNALTMDLQPPQVHDLLVTLRNLPVEYRNRHLFDFEVTHLRPVLAQYPHSRDLLLMLSQVYQHRGEWTLLCALNLYALDVAGDTLAFVNNLILGLTELQAYDEALRWSREWLARAPGNRSLLAHRALLALRIDPGHEEAIPYLTEWIEADASNPAPYGLRARAYLRTGENREAERDLFKVLELNPDLPQTYFDLVVLSLREDDVQQARAWLKRYRDRVPASEYRKQVGALKAHPELQRVFDE